MADPSPTPSRALAMGKTIAKFVAAWGLVAFVLSSESVSRADAWLRDAIYRVLAGFPSLAELGERTYWAFQGILGMAFFLTLFWGSILAPLGAATRMLARARIRAGHADFLDRVRAWTAAHPRAIRWILASPSLLWVLWMLLPGPYEWNHQSEWLGGIGRAAVPGALAVWGTYGMAKKGLGELLAPTMGGNEAATRFEIGPDEIVFDAVAVTRRTLAIVSVFTALSIATPVYLATRPILQLFHDRSLFYLVGAYIAFAGIGAFAFRKASRIAVGVDGVHVRGTSRARFFAYRDIDSARVSGGDIELVRRGRVVLRLQLHGEDAARRDAVLARITENLTHVKEGRGAVAAQLVATSTKEALARVAHGGADYRMATLTREQLWALVEGPEVEASARKAAAEALVASAASSDERERARLRVAAERCAEPHVRVALEEIASEGERPGDEARRSARAARVV